VSEYVVLTENDEQAMRELLVGRRIVAAERGEFATGKWNDDDASGRLTLDDGTVILVVPNEGCGGCTAGLYALEHLATVDNAITDVRLAAEGKLDEYGEGPLSYRIYVMADAVEINAVQVDGDDGNGYYGTGYELFISRPDATV
jgi:hypothetical protein